MNRRLPVVPTIRQVQPGTSVNVVLKADQPTGRTVQGVVRDILTRGNHPRGIKVRLMDGRVGRVQTMAMISASALSNSSPPVAAAGGSSFALPTPSSEEPCGIDRLVGGVQDASIATDYHELNRTYGAGRSPRRGGREVGRGGDRSRGGDDEQELPAQQIGLDAYVKEGKRRKPGRGRASSSHADAEEENEAQAAVDSGPSEIVICPVCDKFEGDEAAVSHHVAGHFESAS